MEEENFAQGRSSSADREFDRAIGCIEDIIMENEFQSLQLNFMAKYYLEFEDTEENKLCYTDIHNEYINLVESYLHQQLSARIPGFSMKQFQKQLIERKQELEGEVFEMLLTFSDFLAFKEMFLDFRAEKEGTSIDLSSGFKITPLVGKDSGFDSTTEEEAMTISPRKDDS